jgi:hypothetical protein
MSARHARGVRRRLALRPPLDRRRASLPGGVGLLRARLARQRRASRPARRSGAHRPVRPAPPALEPHLAERRRIPRGRRLARGGLRAVLRRRRGRRRPARVAAGGAARPRPCSGMAPEATCLHRPQPGAVRLGVPVGGGKARRRRRGAPGARRGEPAGLGVRRPDRTGCSKRAPDRARRRRPRRCRDGRRPPPVRRRSLERGRRCGGIPRDRDSRQPRLRDRGLARP